MATQSTTAVAQWSGDLSGIGTIEAASFRNEISVPASMSGRGVGTNTEDLLVSAAATCMSITLGITLTRNKLAYDSLRVRSTGHVEFQQGLRLVSIFHEVDVVIAANESLSNEERENILRVAQAVEKSCFVSRAISGNADVVVKAKIVAA